MWLTFLVVETNVLHHFLNTDGINEIKKATILWSVLNWGQYSTSRYNDSAFVFNWMVGYNTSLFDDVDKAWQWYCVNGLSE